ncbi:MAG: Nucleoid-associated protein NCTC12475_01104 [uncultured Campylobacterales bacterium]|uniref:Nucleoid-associated protein HELGO_WM2617 n=1 Tax=uncultured Campylobacterales bacterium TaxID=352960 RepID=A0A6S6SE54_9BACT|nr:MAG: Nucleoid-associated protein NCTC12475_01104 [uncultured Campylobacterales bacterium]
MFDFSQMGDMFKDIEKNAESFKEELANKKFTASSGAGMVNASINGNGELVDLNIDDSLLEDKASLEILLISAINEAQKLCEENKKSGLMSMMGGGIPGFGGK